MRALLPFLLLAACTGEPSGDDTDKPAAPGCWYGYADVDGDGFGDAAAKVELCEGDDASAYVSDASDCDDTDAAVYVGAAELCNDVDDDCDGTVDGEGAAEAGTWYTDADGDGFGDPAAPVRGCEAPAGAVADATDCDDADDAAYPGGYEVCGDGVDGDCDGVADEGVAYAYWAAPGTGTLADGEAATWSVADCTAGAEGCPTIGFTRSGGATTLASFGGGTSFLAGGELPGDVYWDGTIPTLTLEGAVDGTVAFTFTPASAFGVDGLRAVVGVVGTGGAGEGPLLVVADEELLVLGSLAAYGGDVPVFSPPDTVHGSEGADLADDFLFFALDPDATGVTLTVSDGGDLPDTHAYTVGYVLFSSCED